MTQAGSDSDSETIVSPPNINKTLKVTSSAEFEELRQKLQRLKDEERTVDKYLDYLKEQAGVYTGDQLPTQDHLDALPPGVNSVQENMFVRFKDITSMPQYKSETVIGIRAPSGTSLEVPDPDQGMRPGQRRFEMYLNSKGKDKAGHEKGEPINVYLVQPTAEQQNTKEQAGSKNGLGSRETPTQDRNQSPAPSSTQQDKRTSEESPAAATPSTAPSESSRPTHQDFASPARHSDAYRMPPPNHAGDWGYNRGRSQLAAPERFHRSEHGHPTPGYQHPEGPWGPPPPYGGPGAPPPGYYPPRASARQGSGYPPDDVKRVHMSDRRGREESMYPPERYPGYMELQRANPFRSRQHHYESELELEGASSAGDRETAGAFRPPSPAAQQQSLLNMPLQSPSEAHYFRSPSAASGFSPPTGRRTDVRPGGDVQFPLPQFSRDSRDNLEHWRPPKRTPESSRVDEALDSQHR